MMKMTQIQFSNVTAVSAMGYGLTDHAQALQDQRACLRPCDYETARLETFIGRVPNIENHHFPREFSQYFSRNSMLAYAALEQDNMLQSIEAAKKRYGAHRVAVLLGTTTSGFATAEHAYHHRDADGRLPKDFHYQKSAHPFATCDFLREYLQLKGPAKTIATACSSSAKTFIHAQQLLQLDLCDAVLVAGVDSLCLNVLYGFNSLGVLSNKPCQPFDQHRAGLNLGEAAAMVLVERQQDDGIGLLGFGESSDGYHMSSPHPDGLGAKLAMQQALSTANLAPHQVDYINFHGTASELNDRAEDRAVSAIFSNQVPCSSTKGWMGHTLGAAGALETVISYLAIKHNVAWGTLNSTHIDESMNCPVILNNQEKNISTVLTNSFGFGGNNCSLIIGELTS